MPSLIDVPGHGVVEFPDGMSEAQIVSAIRANMRPQTTPHDTGVMGDLKNAAGGFARSGMGVVSNLMRPIDELIGNNPAPTTSDLITGKKPLSAHEQRMERINKRFQNQGYDQNSLSFKGGKLAGDVAITAPIGGILAKGVEAVPVLAMAVPGLAPAIASGGFRTGANLANATAGAKAMDMATRVVGGAVNGGATTALVDPEHAGTGATIGALLPPSAAVVGKIGNAAGSVVRGPAVAEPVRQAVEAARSAGYVIPPSQAKPTLVNRLLEGFSGKITTAQNASARNAAITDNLVADSLGLPAGRPITLDALKDLRRTAGQSYQQIKGAGEIVADPTYLNALDAIAEKYKTAAKDFPSLGPKNMHGAPIDVIGDMVSGLKVGKFDASSAIDAIGVLRESADKAFRSGDTTLAKASKDAAQAMEGVVERHLEASGNSEMLDAFRRARETIAKTYTVEKAFNATTGSVDARKLGALIQRGKPITGGIRQAGEFANRFPKAAQTIEKMGSLPQVSPLDFGALGTLSALTSNPLLMAGVLARPAARRAVLSNVVQNRLANPQADNNLVRMLTDPGVQGALYRSAPVAISR